MAGTSVTTEVPTVVPEAVVETKVVEAKLEKKVSDAKLPGAIGVGELADKLHAVGIGEKR